MNENRVVSPSTERAIDDPLTEILRSGARRLISQAVEAEFETFLASNVQLILPDGRRRMVRHGHDPVRAIQTGIGPVEVQKPKARDRGAPPGARIRFTSNILPKWARRTKNLDALLPVLYLREISAGNFQEALRLPAVSDGSSNKTSPSRKTIAQALDPIIASELFTPPNTLIQAAGKSNSVRSDEGAATSAESDRSQAPARLGNDNPQVSASGIATKLVRDIAKIETHDRDSHTSYQNKASFGVRAGV